MIDVIGYENLYTINTNGDVYSVKRNKYLKHFIDKDGYAYVSLSKNCKGKKFKLHRLLAIHFIPNPDNKPEINHIDGNKLNNELSNLEWCTSSENQLHAFRTGLQRTVNKRKVGKYSLDGELLKVYDSLTDTKKDGFRPPDICSCCKHLKRHKTHMGFKWEYV
jgi:hypothetical protein